MRFAAFALIAAVLMLSPLQARADALNFGGRSCHQHFPCDPSASGFPTQQQLANIADNCGGGGTPGTIEETAGLDSAGCLTTDTSKLAPGSMTQPLCCVKQISTGECGLYCSVVNR
jgi:hypothetical protein